MAHRDIKPANIMWGDDGKVRLVDFGLAIQADCKLHQCVGTPFFMAPEIIRRADYTNKCDIWSVGCVMYMMITGSLPFTGKNKSQVFNTIMDGQYEAPNGCSAEGADLISKMLCLDEKKRYSATQCLEHNWFKVSENLPEKPPVGISDDLMVALKTFRIKSKLHRTVLHMLVKLITRKELHELSD